jgi:hypothetical protein
MQNCKIKVTNNNQQKGVLSSLHQVVKGGGSMSPIFCVFFDLMFLLLLLCFDAKPSHKHMKEIPLLSVDKIKSHNPLSQHWM